MLPKVHSEVGLAERAGRLCSNILGMSSHDIPSSRKRRRQNVQHLQQVKVKDWTKNLVMIDFQGQEANKECPLYEYQKIFDGLIRISSDQSEYEIRAEIVRLVKLKDICTNHLELLSPSSFSFVKVSVCLTLNYCTVEHPPTIWD